MNGGHANILPSTGHQNNITKQLKPQAGKYPTSHIPLFNCCLSVVLYLKKGAYPKMFMLFCHNK